MRGEHLDVPPGEGNDLGVQFPHPLEKRSLMLPWRYQGKIEYPLANLGISLVNGIGEIHQAYRVDRPTGEEDIQDGAHIRHDLPTITQPQGLCKLNSDVDRHDPAGEIPVGHARKSRVDHELRQRFLIGEGPDGSGEVAVGSGLVSRDERSDPG